MITNRIFGTYHYEGGNCDYVLTYGTRSIDEPETDPTLQETQQTESSQKPVSESDMTLYILIGAVALVAVAAVVLVLLKKKKPAEKK